MNAPFLNTITKALPSVSRQCQFRPSQSRLIRSFCSSPIVRSNGRDKTRELERTLLGMAPDQAGKTNPSFSAISGMMKGNQNAQHGEVSADYSRMAQTMESELMKESYADRAPPHRLHCYSHKHNTHVTLTRPNGEPLVSMSCGNLGFRKAARAGYDPAYQLAAHVFGKIHEKGLLLEIQRLVLVLRDFGQGREAFIKVLLGNEGKAIRGLISRVTDSTRIKFGGTRSRRSRRLG
ncbi:Ribosomal protein [Aspergillus sclerotialis]|uniref:Small ribosomal subunit protein uS11m n=1 Tax=Aspergillus sclerotialis TaxID=2070753 RepID=A0A3A2ZY65_9EURO|nr:Ribosomal protein [Aspergillus sclerotialis]